MKNALLAAAMTLSLPAFAGEKVEAPKAYPSSKEFELIKSLAGEWAGTADMHGKKEESKTAFRVTSGGSAVIETMGEGTPHEMVNVYHEVGGKLMMTHYCAIGNAPRMRVSKSGKSSVAFETVAGNGIDLDKTPHMHGLAYKLRGKDRLEAAWTSANMGKEHEKPAVFKYRRVR